MLGCRIHSQCKSQQDYRSKLFCPDRLNYKFESFEKITLPSVVNQTNKNYIWYIFASEYLPTRYREKLLNLTTNYDKIVCVFIKSSKEFKVKLDPAIKYCTIRLDDDDGLSHNFIQNLQKYKHKDKVIISCPNGRKVAIKNHKIVYKNAPYRNKNIALGLCAIGLNIYKCGNHVTIHKRYPIIYDNKKNMFLLNCSKFCDTKRKF